MTTKELEIRTLKSAEVAIENAIACVSIAAEHASSADVGEWLVERNRELMTVLGSIRNHMIDISGRCDGNVVVMRKGKLTKAQEAEQAALRG